MKNVNLALLVFAGLSLTSCGEDEKKKAATQAEEVLPPAEPNQVSNSKKMFLASNIIFDGILNQKAFALDDNVTIDRTTKIPASSVQFSLSNKSVIAASNVQAALEEIAPSLKEVVIGTWKITSYGAQCHNTESEIVFREDGSYELTSGGFVMARVGNCPDYNATSNSGKFEVVGNGLLIFKPTSTSDVLAASVSGLTQNSFSMFSYVYGAVATKK